MTVDKKVARYFNKLDLVIKNLINLAIILQILFLKRLFSPNKKPAAHGQLVFC
jgi:hypothetical protein